jgi:RNA polymerase sigma-70 factor (ECF subfamily)
MRFNPEKELARRCHRGEPSAQKALYDAYCNDMLLLCLRYIPDTEDAREVLMDGFYNCFKNIGSFEYRDEGSLKAWLKKIVVNQCLMHLRKRSGLLAEALPEDDEVKVDNTMIEELSAKEIMNLIQQLPTGYRMVFNLYYFESCSHKEIAALLGISENTSKSQLIKAKRSLQQMLSAYY